MTFAAAAQERKLEVVVVLSQWLADPRHPSIHTRETWLADQMFFWMPDVDVVTVNPGWFADNYMPALEPIAQFGMMPRRNRQYVHSAAGNVLSACAYCPVRHVHGSLKHR